MRINTSRRRCSGLRLLSRKFVSKNARKQWNWHHKAPYRKKNKAKMPEKLALSDGEVIILGGSKESETKWGARADGLRVSRCFNPQPDLDNANVGK